MVSTLVNQLSKKRHQLTEINKSHYSAEVYKYPYCGRPNKNEDYLSEKICCYTIRTRKKIIKKAKWLIVYRDFILRLTNGVVPSQAIGLPISPQTPLIMRSSKKIISIWNVSISAWSTVSYMCSCCNVAITNNY